MNNIRSANWFSSFSGAIALVAMSLSWSAGAQDAEQVDLEALGAEAQDAAEEADDAAVSYTHLTLPTIYSV